MELHRAEMALYFDETISPLRTVETRLNALRSNRPLQMVLIGGLVFLIFSGRFNWARKKSGFLLAFILPKVRTFLFGRLMQWITTNLRFLKS